jgi:hypothetical protein
VAALVAEQKSADHSGALLRFVRWEEIFGRADFCFRGGAGGAFVASSQSPSSGRSDGCLLAGADLANGPGFDDCRIVIAERHSTTQAANGQPLFVGERTRGRALRLARH